MGVSLAVGVVLRWAEQDTEQGCVCGNELGCPAMCWAGEQLGLGWARMCI